MKTKGDLRQKRIKATAGKATAAGREVGVVCFDPFDPGNPRSLRSWEGRGVVELKEQQLSGGHWVGFGRIWRGLWMIPVESETFPSK